MTKVHTLPAGTMAAALVAAKMPATAPASSAHVYFDPTDVLMDKTGHSPELYARAMSSAAWSIDNACIQGARNILFTRYAESELPESEDRFSSFCANVTEMLSHESLYLPGEHDSPEYELAMLMSIRNQWHDAAQAAAAADGKDYNPKSLRELLESEKVNTASVGIRDGFATAAKTFAQGDAAAEKRMFDNMVAAYDLSAKNRAANNVPLRGPLLEVLRTVAGYSDKTYRFDQLSMPKQHNLTSQMIMTVMRTLTDLIPRMARQPIASARMSEAAFQCTKALEAVIASKYLPHEDAITSQVQQNMQRAAKRVACSID